MIRAQTSDALKAKIREIGHTQYSLAKLLGVNRIDITQFVLGNWAKLGKRKHKILRKKFIELGILPAPQLRPRCTCPVCGKVHAEKARKSQHV